MGFTRRRVYTICWHVMGRSRINWQRWEAGEPLRMVDMCVWRLDQLGSQATTRSNEGWGWRVGRRSSTWMVVDSRRRGWTAMVLRSSSRTRRRTKEQKIQTKPAIKQGRKKEKRKKQVRRARKEKAKPFPPPWKGRMRRRKKSHRGDGRRKLKKPSKASLSKKRERKGLAASRYNFFFSFFGHVQTRGGVGDLN